MTCEGKNNNKHLKLKMLQPYTFKLRKLRVDLKKLRLTRVTSFERLSLCTSRTTKSVKHSLKIHTID